MNQQAFPIIRTLDETIAYMQGEILDLIANGRIPDTVECFSDLHDYIDANELGDFCVDAYADAMIAHFGGRDPDDGGMPDAMLDYINECQEAISVWLACDFHRQYKREFPDFFLDVAIPDGFVDESWHNDAMPSFGKALPNGKILRLFIDYADRSLSDFADVDDAHYTRFCLCVGDADDCVGNDIILSSNDYQAILDAIDQWEDAQ